MSLQINKAQPTFLSSLSSKVISNAKSLAPQVGVSATLGYGLKWCGLALPGTTPLNSAGYFGLLPIVRQATHHIFKKINNSENFPSETKQAKAIAKITQISVDMCVPALTACMYNIFATSLFHSAELDTSDIISKQYNLLYYSALISGMGIMLNTATQTISDAFNLEEEQPAKAPAKSNDEAHLILQGKKEEMNHLKEVLSKATPEEISKAIEFYKFSNQVVEAPTS